MNTSSKDEEDNASKTSTFGRQFNHGTPSNQGPNFGHAVFQTGQATKKGPAASSFTPFQDSSNVNNDLIAPEKDLERTDPCS